MNDPEQRAQWAEHLLDEADAIAAQQVTAGASHEPMAGPLPFTQDNMTDAIRLAVTEERARCAAVAEAFATEARLSHFLPAATTSERAAAAAVARRIAQLLRVL
ncbi:hypothetical protein [Ramlibacter albus]|uniref:Uncharacterized protein n=1 Tax=Ramlibacter albus TaxID=2079448 RepID=A0A923S6Z6_9BURK|nr:hypothetical protein [Ramlibacter albus]MBC5766657.1 hypothetical protein [Ramlibacter albus]